MDKKHKLTILILSLSVLTLATVSTILSLSQGGVLGISTINIGKSLSVPVPRTSIYPTSIPAKNLSGVPCRDFSFIFSSASTSPSDPFFSRAFSLFRRYCPDLELPTPTPGLATGCKTGVNSFAVGLACTYTNTTSEKTPGYYSARVTCHDGSTHTIGDPSNRLCYQKTSLEALAAKTCQGKTNCPRPTPSIKEITNLPRPTRVTTTSLEPQSCGWCGTSCTFIRPNMACPMIAPPSNQQCIYVSTDQTCKVISYKTNSQ